MIQQSTYKLYKDFIKSSLNMSLNTFYKLLETIARKETLMNHKKNTEGVMMGLPKTIPTGTP